MEAGITAEIAGAATAATESIPLDVLLLMFGIGFLGVLAHWFKAAINKQAPWNLFKYLFMDKPGASGTMFGFYCAAIWGLYTLGAFDLIEIEWIKEAWENGVLYKPLLHAVIEAAGAGYFCDSAFNKSGLPATDRREQYAERK